MAMTQQCWPQVEAGGLILIAKSPFSNMGVSVDSEDMVEGLKPEHWGKGTEGRAGPELAGGLEPLRIVTC